MLQPRWLKRFVPLLVCLVLLVGGCSSAPSRYDQVQRDTTGFGAPAAVDRNAQQGGTFNQFFPDNQGDFQVIPYQEKKGFAEYKLQRGDQTLAMLSISDTTSLPTAAAKYNDATETVGGYPMVNQGNTATGLLVNGRYQVKVLSRDPSFTQADRVAWLQKFDLQGLAQLRGALNAPKAARSPATEAPTASKPGFKLPQIELPSLSPSPQPAS